MGEAAREKTSACESNRGSVGQQSVKRQGGPYFRGRPCEPQDIAWTEEGRRISLGSETADMAAERGHNSAGLSARRSPSEDGLTMAEERDSKRRQDARCQKVAVINLRQP